MRLRESPGKMTFVGGGAVAVADAPPFAADGAERWLADLADGGGTGLSMTVMLLLLAPYL